MMSEWDWLDWVLTSIGCFHVVKILHTSLPSIFFLFSCPSLFFFPPISVLLLCSFASSILLFLLLDFLFSFFPYLLSSALLSLPLSHSFLLSSFLSLLLPAGRSRDKKEERRKEWERGRERRAEDRRYGKKEKRKSSSRKRRMDEAKEQRRRTEIGGKKNKEGQENKKNMEGREVCRILTTWKHPMDVNTQSNQSHSDIISPHSTPL